MENNDSDASLEEKIDTTNAGKKILLLYSIWPIVHIFLFHTLQVYAYLGAEARARKRERDQARWHAMTKEKRDEKNKKRREAYQIKKEQRLHDETTNGN
jgi:hypothetical protein